MSGVSFRSRPTPAKSQDWWRGAFLYQIYPRSFQDSNGDGIGDLAGVTRRLDYVQQLGVDAIWISPFFPSPMKDFGYDVSDYRGIDPIFGRLEDFQCLLAESHRRGLAVLIDLVLSHSSDQHPWFLESQASRENARADWYVWADPKPDGSPPNNWLSVFGGSAWQWHARRRQYYLHNFLPSQPDFNFHNSEVQDALLDIARFWLEMGVDGFRLDTVNFYFHSPTLSDNPPLARQEPEEPEEPQETACDVPASNPYGYQAHLYDKTQPENLVFLSRLRRLTAGYDNRTLLGEVGDSERSLATLSSYTRGNELLHMGYGFDFLGAQFGAPYVARTLRQSEALLGSSSWACWAFSNHDSMRHISRWGRPTAAFARFTFGLFIFLRGSLCLYQGEELGFPEANLTLEQLVDPYGLAFWPDFKGRDGCRTPMAWETSAPQAGFSESSSLWLPIPPEHQRHAVDTQQQDADSVLSFYKRLIAFRQAHPSLRHGSLALEEKSPTLLELRRSLLPDSSREEPPEDLIGWFNFAPEPYALEAPRPQADGASPVPVLRLLVSEPEGGQLDASEASSGPVYIPPLGFLIAQRMA